MSSQEEAGQNGRMSLEDGSRIAVIGGGPAGSLFSFFALDMAGRSGISIELDIYEPRDFDAKGPKGCNMCGGIVSESLVQMLATEGILLPSDVVQRGIEAYVLHTDVGSVRIDTPAEEKRIASVYRGGGPKKAAASDWRSFDGYLLSLAVEQGARHIAEAVASISANGEKPTLTTDSRGAQTYDLIVVAAGVNSQLFKSINDAIPEYTLPRTTRTVIREYDIGAEQVNRLLGDSMHLFLMNLAHVEFAAAIPKGSSVTLCLLGEGIGKELLTSFLENRRVSECLPKFPEQACACSPKMSISPAVKPYRDRVVFVGDCGVSRLYKDGIGAAYREAKAAAATAIFWGVAKSDFEKHYRPALDAIANDNRYGHIVFAATRMIQRFAFAQRAVLAMVGREQKTAGSAQRMSTVLWDSFTGSASYRDIFMRTMHPAFWLVLAKHLLVSLLLPGRGRAYPGEESKSRMTP